jgi:NAD/NADP transhydrogenase alpha subunit
VKEGVGVGGATIAAMAKSKGAITKESMLKEIERNYEQLVNSK